MYVVVVVILLVAPTIAYNIRRPIRGFKTYNIRLDVSTYGLEDVVAKEPEKSFSVSDLPNTFDDAIDRAAGASLACIGSGNLRLRVEFDTSVGDMTYTALKNAMPFMKGYANRMATRMDLYPRDKPIRPVDESALTAEGEKEELEKGGEQSGLGSEEGSQAAGTIALKAVSSSSTTSANTPWQAAELAAQAGAVMQVEVAGGGGGAASLSSSPTPEDETKDAEKDPKTSGQLRAEAKAAAKARKAKDEADWAEALAKLEAGITDNTPARSLNIFFPDMGAAALARRDWKMNSFDAQVPLCVRCSNIQNDRVSPTDELVVLLCPLSYEVDFVRRVQEECDAMNTPCVMINPDLVNMDQGYGTRARNLRNELINSFTTVYKLKTMPAGAVVREWPRGFSVWAEDEAQDDGYTLLDTFTRDPSREAVNDLYDAYEQGVTVEDIRGDNNPVIQGVQGVLDFFQGLSRL